MKYVPPKYYGVVLVLISSLCFAFVPNSAKIALDEGTSLSFLLVSRYAIGVALLLPIMFLTKTKLAVPNYLAPRIIKASVLALGLIWATYHAVEFLDVGLVLIILYSFPFISFTCLSTKNLWDSLQIRIRSETCFNLSALFIVD